MGIVQIITCQLWESVEHWTTNVSWLTKLLSDLMKGGREEERGEGRKDWFYVNWVDLSRNPDSDFRRLKHWYSISSNPPSPALLFSHLLSFLSFFLINFYWSIVASQCCVSFYCTAHLLSFLCMQQPWAALLIMFVKEWTRSEKAL